MRDAVIVSTARTPLTKAARGSFNNTTSPTLGAYSVAAAVERAGVEGGEIDDVLFGAAMQQGSQTMNVARLIGLRAGLPVTVPGMSIDRQCSSGLMTIATAAKQIIVDRDVSAAIELGRDDEIMDQLRRASFTQVLGDDWTHGVEAAVDIALLGRYYERIADHAVSIANRVVFVVTGEDPRAAASEA